MGKRGLLGTPSAGKAMGPGSLPLAVRVCLGLAESRWTHVPPWPTRTPKTCPRRPTCGRGASEAVELDPSLNKAVPTADMLQPRQGRRVGKREQGPYSEAPRGCPQGGGSSPEPGSTGRQGRGAAPFLSGLTLQSFLFHHL